MRGRMPSLSPTFERVLMRAGPGWRQAKTPASRVTNNCTSPPSIERGTACSLDPSGRNRIRPPYSPMRLGVTTERATPASTDRTAWTKGSLQRCCSAHCHFHDSALQLKNVNRPMAANCSIPSPSNTECRALMCRGRSGMAESFCQRAQVSHPKRAGPISQLSVILIFLYSRCSFCIPKSKSRC